MSKLAVQLASDLHLEFRENKDFSKILIPSAPILLLCGDICACGSEKDFEIVKRFLDTIESKFETIVYVPGNHEFYTHKANKRLNTMTDIEMRFKNYLKTKKNIHFLNNNILKIKHGNDLYYIVGTTLWTKIDKPYEKEIQQNMNDYSAILLKDETMKSAARRNRVADTNQRHLKSVKFIKSAISRAKAEGAKCIVATHHCPYMGDGNSLLHAYYTDMTQVMGPPVILWTHGHTHINKTMSFGGTKVQSNCLGYPYERCNFDQKCVIKI